MHIDFSVINPYIEIYGIPALLFVLGWIAKAIKQNWLTDFVARLSPEILRDIYEKAQTSEGRKTLAVELVISEGNKLGLDLTNSQALWLVDNIVKIVSKWVN